MFRVNTVVFSKAVFPYHLSATAAACSWNFVVEVMAYKLLHFCTLVSIDFIFCLTIWELYLTTILSPGLENCKPLNSRPTLFRIITKVRKNANSLSSYDNKNYRKNAAACPYYL